MSTPSATPWTISGQGLAGTCLAWALWQRGEPFQLVDRELGGSSRVAAGLINPVTGKHFVPGWRVAEFLPQALASYAELERRLDVRLWHPLPIVRLAATDKEWRKISSKLQEETVSPWVKQLLPAPEGWAGAVELHGGGRLDTRLFLDASRDVFRRAGLYRQGDCANGDKTILCEGAAGLLGGSLGPHRCAKGEILTLRADWPADHIRIGAGGWLIPLGEGRFKAGATYEWEELNESPTPAGRRHVEQIACRLGGPAFEVIAQEAGIRPILRCSQPLIGPLGNGSWVFNGLGSKGSLYAPGVARQLAAWLLDGTLPDDSLQFSHFRKHPSPASPDAP